MKRYELEIIYDYINKKDVIDEDELKRKFFQLFPERSERYFNYYLLEMYLGNILYKYGTKKLKPCRDRKVFSFNLNIETGMKYRIEKITPGIIVSIWSIASLSHFSSLQMFNDIIIVETFSYSKEYVLNFLLSEGKFAIYEEDYSIMSKYSKMTQLFIVRTLYDECPIVRKNVDSTMKSSRRDDRFTFVTVPKIEKILVDLIVDEIYKVLLSNEIHRIFYHLLKEYQINMTTVMRYAKKRHSEHKLLNYFEYIDFDIERGEFK